MAQREDSDHELVERLREALGPSAATRLMGKLPPTGWGQAATKDDLRAEANALAEKVDLKLDAVRHELLAEIHRSARTQAIAMSGVFAVFNAAMFAALKLT